jgi:hypothetical protein
VAAVRHALVVRHNARMIGLALAHGAVDPYCVVAS